jgi:AraC-like DNA-binding protein
MPASDLRVMTDGLASLGYDCDRLLPAAGLGDANLDDPDARVSCEAVGRLVAMAQQERFTPNLALALARLTPIGAYPLLDYLVLTSDTVGAGLRQLACYRRLIGDPAAMTFDEEADAVRVGLPGTAAPFSVEYNVSLMVLHLRNETDGRFAPGCVSFRHKPDDSAGFELLFGCPVLAPASWSGMSVPQEAWRLPLRRRDPVLRGVLEAQANGLLSRLPRRTGVALDVQRALASAVVGGDTRIASLARRLAMSGRTLQRRLTAEGMSYQELLDDARKEAAGQHLSEPTLAISEIAYLLGYSEPAPFHRAFKRWYGTTPDLFRRGQRSAASGTAAAQASPAVSKRAVVRRRNG